jgi:hypothetical protein
MTRQDHAGALVSTVCDIVAAMITLSSFTADLPALLRVDGMSPVDVPLIDPSGREIGRASIGDGGRIKLEIFDAHAAEVLKRFHQESISIGYTVQIAAEPAGPGLPPPSKPTAA